MFVGELLTRDVLSQSKSNDPETRREKPSQRRKRGRQVVSAVATVQPGRIGFLTELDMYDCRSSILRRNSDHFPA